MIPNILLISHGQFSNSLLTTALEIEKTQHKEPFFHLSLSYLTQSTEASFHSFLPLPPLFMSLKDRRKSELEKKNAENLNRAG